VQAIDHPRRSLFTAQHLKRSSGARSSCLRMMFMNSRRGRRPVSEIPSTAGWLSTGTWYVVGHTCQHCCLESLRAMCGNDEKLLRSMKQKQINSVILRLFCPCAKHRHCSSGGNGGRLAQAKQRRHHPLLLLLLHAWQLFRTAGSGEIAGKRLWRRQADGRSGVLQGRR
jgi:hypothetical protein